MERISPPPESSSSSPPATSTPSRSLYHQFQGEVYAWIVRMVRDPAAAEELTVETFGESSGHTPV